MTELFSLFGTLGGLVQQVRHLLRRHPHAVVGNAQQYVPGIRVGGDIQQHAAVAALGLQPVEDGVFHQRLQGEPGNRAVAAKGLAFNAGDLDLQIAAVAVLLDGKVIVEQCQLLLQRHQLLGALGDALGQPRKGGYHLGNAGRVLDGGHPADAVKGVVDKVRVHLVLQHPVFQLLLAALVLHPASHQTVHVLGQLVDAPADVAQLVVPLHRVVGAKAAAAHGLDALLQRLHRAGDDPLQPVLHQKAQSPDDGNAKGDEPQVHAVVLQKGARGQKLHQRRTASVQRYLDYIVVLPVQLHLALPRGLLGHAVMAAGALGIIHLPQRVLNLDQAAVFDLPQAAAHLPVQRTAVGQAVTRCRVGDNGSIQRKVGAAPVQSTLAAADRLAESDAVRAAGQQRVGGELHPVPLGEELLYAGAVERRRSVQRAELQMPVVLIGNKKAEDMAVQGAGIVFFLYSFVGGNGLGAVDILLRDVPPHGAVDGSPVQKGIGAVQTGLNGGGHQPQIELCRLQGVGAHILVGEDEQCCAHSQRGKDGKKAHPPHDLPPQREAMTAFHDGASFPGIFCILSFIQYRFRRCLSTGFCMKIVYFIRFFLALMMQTVQEIKKVQTPV